jgi:uncharacterized protein (DUF58 family)
MLMRADARPVTHRSGLDRLAAELQTSEGDVPEDMRLPRYGTVVLFSDFLWPLEDVRILMARFAGAPVTGYLMQILDPAETALPYQGRIRFRGMESDGDVLIPRTESIQSAYLQRLKAQQEGLSEICATAGFRFGVHHTDQPPELALLTLYTALADR